MRKNNNLYYNIFFFFIYIRKQAILYISISTFKILDNSSPFLLVNRCNTIPEDIAECY